MVHIALAWLLTGHALYLAWSWLHPRLWVPADAKEFTNNGSKDSLLRTFHRQRGTWRFLGMLVPALLASAVLGTWHVTLFGVAVPVAGGWPWLLGVVGLLAIAGGYWLWWFNPHLNLARKLDYIKEYHVSWNPNAAWLDRIVWRLAWLKCMLPCYNWRQLLWPALSQKAQLRLLPSKPGPPAKEDLWIVHVAGPLYQKVLRAALIAGLAAYGLSLLFITFHSLAHGTQP